MTEHDKEVVASDPQSAPVASDKQTDQKDDDDVAVEIEEGKKKGDPPKVTVQTNNASNPRASQPCCTSRCCVLTLDIVAVVCLYLMCIFFICGSAFKHPETYENLPEEPYAFFVIASLLFITKASIEVHKRKGNSVLNTVFPCLGIGAGVFWFIASVFLFRKTFRPKVFGGLWILGVLLNLTLITFDIVMVFRSSTKYLFHFIALLMECLANLMFLVGAAMATTYAEHTLCDRINYAGLIIAGSVLYLIHAVFYTLKLFLKGYAFTLQVSRTEPSSED